METQEASELKSIDAKPLVDDGLDGIFKKLCEVNLPSKASESDPEEETTEETMPEPWLMTFNYLQDNADRRACVTEEEQKAIVDKIINSVNGEDILAFMNSCRTACADCINNACVRRGPILGM